MGVFNLAVAGAGLIGRRHIELITANAQTRLGAVIDPTPVVMAFAASLNVPHFNSLDEMFNQQGTLKINGVILATLPAAHSVPSPCQTPWPRRAAGSTPRVKTPPIHAHPLKTVTL